MQSLQKDFDELKISTNTALVDQFEPSGNNPLLKPENEYIEKIILSTNIFKLNEENQKEEYVFILTNKYLYEIHQTRIMKKIPNRKIKGVTGSNISNEFIIHIPGEPDLRYQHSERRNQIIESLGDLHQQIHGTALTITNKDEVDLGKFIEQKEDKKENNDENGGTEENKDGYDTIYSKEKGRNVTLDDFILLKVLGRGTFGKVMLVRLKDTGELFALKSMKKAELIEKEQLEHTKTEKMILQNMNHPFLVKLEYCFQTREKIFFVMHFMRGGELFQHLRKDRRFPESRVKFYGAQLALALGHLHQNSIIYRDMKPENLLMDEDGYLAISDFGMAKVLVDDTLATSFCGTPEYLAPEVITSEGHGRDADWWGLGILMYELLIGIPPFYHQNHNLMFQMIQNSPVKFHPQIKISDEGKDFILRCLAKNPNLRLGHKEDIKEVMEHPWFKDVDWDALLKKEIPAPYKPNFLSDTSTEYFDEEFTSEEAINSFTASIDPNALKEFDEQFQSVNGYQ